MRSTKRHGLLLLFGLLASLLPAQNLLDRPVDFTCDNLSAPAALDELARQTGIGVAYSPDFFGKKPAALSLQFRQEKLSLVLESILADTDVGFREVGGQVVLFQKKKEEKALFTVSGWVTDAESGERLIGASVIEAGRKVGTVTNEFGFFSLTMPAGRVGLRFGYLGFSDDFREIELSKNERLRIGLRPGGELPQVTVFSADTLSMSLLPSNLRPDLPLNAAANLPNLGGEADLGRLAMLLPGVTTGADGLGGLHVRGCDADQTMVLFDDVPVFYGTHALGMFTIFNPDVVSSARLWKGDVPARFGGRTGSVLDIRTEDGNLLRPETELNLGLLATRVSLQTPVLRKKISLLLTGRRSNFEPWTKRASKKQKREKGRTGQTIYQFLDGNAKLNWETGRNDRFFISFYDGRDDLTDDENARSILSGSKPDSTTRELTYAWENRFLAVRWNHVWGDRTFSNLTLTRSRFRYRNHFFFQHEVFPKPDSALLLTYQELDYLSQVEDRTARLDFDFFPNPRHHLKFGAAATRRGFVPGYGSRTEYEILDTAFVTFLLRPDTTGGFEGAVYVEDSWQPGPRLSLDAGLRGSLYKGDSAVFTNIEPRLSANWRPLAGLSIKASAASTAQYLHVLRGWDVGTPADLWVSAGRGISPQRGLQAEVSVEKNFSRRLSASVAAYWSRVGGLHEWKSSVLLVGDRDALLGSDLAGKTTRGEGRARGVEAMVSGSAGGFSGWASYALSTARRQFDSLNLGRSFPFRYDRKHQFSAVFAQKLNEYADLTASLTLATGDAITNDTAEVVLGQPSFLDLNIAYKIQSEQLNNLRLPSYRRLDAGINIRLPARKGRENRLSFGVYNILSNLNARYAYRQPSGKRKLLPGLGTVPYLNFSTKF